MRTTERTSAEERAAWRESVGIGARISSNVMARAAERLLDDLDEARALLRECLALDVWPYRERCECGGDPHPDASCASGACGCTHYIIEDADMHDLKRRIEAHLADKEVHDDSD